ncbi:MAG: hypothetical protein RMM53_03820, partial [Bacteroidia bacterium]|nr:hypothetical protein [Bacteroidia bacterium]MDW8333324.1 hypothetical protein [Bacteroidia bacterium]
MYVPPRSHPEINVWAARRFAGLGDNLLVALFVRPRGILKVLLGKIGLAAGLFFTVIASGVLGFRYVAGYDWIDAA